MDLSLITKTENVAVAPFALSEMRAIYTEILAAQEEVGGTILYRAKIPSGGAKAFEIVTGNDDTDTTVQKLVGVVIHSQKCSARFDEDTRGLPPVCASPDGVIGIEGEVEHVCADCPFNRFGTAKKGKGKACKNMIRLYMMVEGSPIPIVVSLPPTSIEGWRNYRLGVLGPRQLKPYEVVTELSLTTETNRAGDRYSVVRPRLIGRLSDADKANAAFFASGFQPQLVVDESDYNTEEKEGTAHE